MLASFLVAKLAMSPSPWERFVLLGYLVKLLPGCRDLRSSFLTGHAGVEVGVNAVLDSRLVGIAPRKS